MPGCDFGSAAINSIEKNATMENADQSRLESLSSLRELLTGSGIALSPSSKLA